jgi:hypothetical protein
MDEPARKYFELSPQISRNPRRRGLLSQKFHLLRILTRVAKNKSGGCCDQTKPDRVNEAKNKKGEDHEKE